MERIAFFDAKPYDRLWFDHLNTQYDIRYIQERLTESSARLAQGCTASVAFVNDVLDRRVMTALHDAGIRIVCMRCAGFNNVDLTAASELGMTVTSVPDYSPHAVAEHAMALTMALNRNIHRAYARTREFNFSLNGLNGFDMYGKTAGVIGTGRIGKAYAQICVGFGMNVIAYDPYPDPNADIEYVSKDDLFAESDCISLHCPLTDESRHIIDENALSKMKKNALVINTSRGALVDSRALLNALKADRIRGAALDVYEEESGIFFEDASREHDRDDVLSLLITMPNVIVTSHQGFLTDEALSEIARSVLTALDEFFKGVTPKTAITKELLRV